MVRLEYKAARRKFGKIQLPQEEASPHHHNPRTKYSDSKYFCGLSILHDVHRNESWAIAIKEEIIMRHGL